MLTRYKKNLEKIAMGLLSFMPEEKDVKKLQQTIKEYETNPDWHLYLWKEEDVLGAIGVRIEDEINAVIQHISVNPSHRNLGIGKKMVNAVTKLYEEKYSVCADEMTEGFYNKCGKNTDSDEQI
ncbi:riboflavin biosynthesis RibT protein [Oceanobacillus limi]|uniref:Riboflavin biosynthesis RibT protein n=1 Tax=Oceanobacillus limi TaxID=930131 RepID=A0A1H9ZJ17_9BACI|nr:GNAT family N-acetyltransferase [Oceanobacillus limi]SES81593.1 riboflavin biosynthesis RibT protein [Oceanobacillus limi]